MRFQSIEIHNYRQYRNLTFEFPKKTSCDLHVIIATNGVGKTNLLNAINWCIYGDEPHLSGGDNTQKENILPLCNTKAIEETKARDEEICDLYVKIIAEDNDIQYVFLRKANWNVKTELQTGRDDFSITVTGVNGESSIVRSDQATLIINRFLPKKIRQYFYFDGEQLLYYFNLEKDRVQNIKDSINEIAGVNTLIKVKDHLNEIKKEYQKQMGRLVPELELKQKDYNELNNHIEMIKQEKEVLEQQNKEALNKIHELDKKSITGSDAIIEKNNLYNKNHEMINVIKGQLIDKYQNRARFVKKYLKLLFFYHVDKQTKEYIDLREKTDSINTDVGVNAIKSSIEQHNCQLCHQHIPAEIEKKLEELIVKYDKNESLQKLAEIKSDIRRSLDISHYKLDKKSLFDEINNLERKKKQLEVDNDKLYQVIRNFNVEGIQSAMEQKNDLLQLMEENSKKIGSDSMALQNLEVEKKKKKEILDKAISDNTTLESIRKENTFAEDAEEIIFKIQKDIVDDVKNQMQLITMEIFEHLIWKKNTYDHITVDDNFQVKLYDKEGRSCLDSCSASERELLALAFTIALHKVSRYDNLLFIDTPVGRVSDENRSNFVKVLLDLSRTKQLILAFTPAEYSSDVDSVFRRDLISSYTVLTTTDDESQTIKEG